MALGRTLGELTGQGRGKVLLFCWLGWVFDFFDLILFSFLMTAIAGDLEEGRGTLGKLLKDPSIADNIEKITGDLAEGRGTLGLLLTEDEVYQDIRQIVDDLADASAALREGRGTLAKLLYEDEMYAEMQRALGVLTGSLEEAREAAPIATFLNTVFLGF